MNILTIDLEEWYIYEQYPKGGRNYYLPIINNYLNEILAILEEFNIKATFFCLGIIAKNNPEIIKQIVARDHDIGCHSYNHILLNKHSFQSFKDDTHIAIDSLEQTVGKKVTLYRAPAFSITSETKWALEILIEEGIKYDSSIFPSKRNFDGFHEFEKAIPITINISGNSIKEFPINTLNFFGKNFIFSGGGYFRLFPYFIIQQLMNKSNYNMAYFHIRDFDVKQKRVISPRYFQSYFGIKNAFPKFKKLINDYSFISITEAARKINWDQNPTIDL